MAHQTAASTNFACYHDPYERTRTPFPASSTFLEPYEQFVPPDLPQPASTTMQVDVSGPSTNPSPNAYNAVVKREHPSPEAHNAAVKHEYPNAGTAVHAPVEYPSPRTAVPAPVDPAIESLRHTLALTRRRLLEQLALNQAIIAQRNNLQAQCDGLREQVGEMRQEANYELIAIKSAVEEIKGRIVEVVGQLDAVVEVLEH